MTEESKAAADFARTGLLPLVPFDTGDWAVSKNPEEPHGIILWLPPSHPFVCSTPEGREAKKVYDAFSARMGWTAE